MIGSAADTDEGAVLDLSFNIYASEVAVGSTALVDDLDESSAEALDSALGRFGSLECE